MKNNVIHSFKAGRPRLRLTFNKMTQAGFLNNLYSCKDRQGLSTLKDFAELDSIGRPRTQTVLKYLFEYAFKILATGDTSLLSYDFPTLISNWMATTLINPERHNQRKAKPSIVHRINSTTYAKVDKSW